MVTDEPGESLSLAFIIHMTLDEATCSLESQLPHQQESEAWPPVCSGRPTWEHQLLMSSAYCKLRYNMSFLLGTHIICKIYLDDLLQRLFSVSSDNTKTSLFLVLLVWS